MSNLFTIGGKTTEIADELLLAWERLMAAGVNPGSPGVPEYADKAVRQWRKHQDEAGSIMTDGDRAFWQPGASAIPSGIPSGIPSRAAPALPNIAVRNVLGPTGGSVSTKTNNCVWFHTITGTGAQSASEVKPNDPIELSDLKITSDDATARITSIKQGSTELVGGSGSGILASTWVSGFYRALFAGLVVTRENPVSVTMTHAGSGTNITTVELIGFKSKNAGCSL